MKPALTTLILLCIASFAPAQQEQRFAPITPYVDGQTLLVAHLDMKRLDFDAADNKLLELLRAVHRRDFTPQGGAADAREAIAAAERWREEFLMFGGQHVYAVYSLNDIPQELPFLVVPLGKGANGQAIRSLLLTGSADGGNEPASHWPRVAESVNETAVIAGVQRQIDRAKTMKPAPRPEINSAAATLPADAAIALLVVPSPDTRKAAESLLPAFPKAFGPDAARKLVRGLVFASVGTDLSPQSPLSITIQSEDPAAAKAMTELLRTGLAELARHLPNPPAAAALPGFNVHGDRVVTSLDNATTRAFLSGTVLPALAANQLRAQRVRSASNVRQILQGLMLHANDHKGNWPDDIRELTRTVDLSPRSLEQPYRSAKGRYVYLKPAIPANELQRPDRTIVLYEENPLPPLIVVGFADGHSEVFRQPDFEKLLKEQQQQAKPQ
jgi:hypothetical protein